MSSPSSWPRWSTTSTPTGPTGPGVRSLSDVVEYERANADVELPWFGDAPGPGWAPAAGLEGPRRGPVPGPGLGGRHLPRACPRRGRRPGGGGLRAGLEERPGDRWPCRRRLELDHDPRRDRRLAHHERARCSSTAARRAGHDRPTGCGVDVVGRRIHAWRPWWPHRPAPGPGGGPRTWLRPVVFRSRPEVAEGLLHAGPVVRDPVSDAAHQLARR